MTMRGLAGLAVALGVACVLPASAYYAGGGKDVAKGNDCLIGYDHVETSDVTLDGKKQVVRCMDCDPACDVDGVAEANGVCTLRIGACINQAEVGGCVPPATLDKASGFVRVRGFRGPIAIEMPAMGGAQCGPALDVQVPLKESKKGPKDGKASVTLSATVKKDPGQGIDRSRTDKDVLGFVCVPRPTGEACPSASTTTSSTSSTTITTTSLASTTSTTMTTTSTTSSSVPAETTTSTAVVTTSSTSVTSTTQTTTTTSTSVTSTTEITSTTVLTSSTSTTVTTSTTTSTVVPPLCGNGAVDSGESCDDGNNGDNDACPGNCTIASCTPIPGTQRPATVSFTPPPGVSIAAMTVLVNYPEGLVTIPGTGAISATYFVPTYPTSEVLTRGIDLDHALRGLVADSAPVPAGPIFQVLFQDCAGAEPPVGGAFHCTVLDASDDFTNPVAGVTCAVVLP